MSKHSKMYIAVLDQVPDHMVPVLVAHSVLNASVWFQKVSIVSGALYDEWLANSYRKVVIKVDAHTFFRISELGGVYLGHENKTLEGAPSCAVVCPTASPARVLSTASLWTPSTAGQIASLERRLASAEARLSDYAWRDSPGQGAY